MHRWSPLNERQLALLGRLANGKESEEPWDPGEFRTAYALRDRGLVTIKRSGSEVDAKVTEAGTFYIEHGHHPDDPAHAGENKIVRDKAAGGTRSASYADRPVALARRAKAKELIERLVADRRVTFTKPDDATVTEWRRVIDYAKRHSLIPEGKRIESLRMWNRDLQISLVAGPHPNSLRQRPDEAPPVHVPTQLRSPHPVVAALRDDEGRLVVPAPLRRRSLLLLQGLAAEAVRRGHKVKEHEVPSRHRSHVYTYNGRHYPSSYSRRDGELDLVVDGFIYTVTIQQEFPQSTDPERSKSLVIELGYSQASRQSRWADRKRWVLEDILGAVLREIETRAVEDAQRKADEERAKAEREVRWRAAMEKAKELAAQEQYAEVLRAQAGQWQEAASLTAYCNALERRLEEPAAREDDAAVASARGWLAWARRYVQSLDPLTRLPAMPTAREPKPEELALYLNGWSPHGPEAHRGWGAR
ncbi:MULTISPECIES: hypothetical protein [Streptomyces diastaticus group]|uniref:PE-PGRS family protein n=1 Tax=Streptomyces gougerotii TaxID=53448 RepID=A0A8H9HR88_9ACTN|nr:hypothetical protein [Streptomyces gougerotii]GFH77445.1 hypothetical protein Sgou_21150 [Streptomyces gougerotii]GGU82999.1 hypothetical protein GCM10010227_41570 [Streptomyces gougerotii]